MNKFIKFFIALLGGVNVAFSIFIPIAISLLIINTINFSEEWHTFAILLAGIISSVYRAIDVAILRG